MELACEEERMARSPGTEFHQGALAPKMLRKTSLSLVFYFCLLVARKSRSFQNPNWFSLFTLSCYAVAKAIPVGASLAPLPPFSSWTVPVFEASQERSWQAHLG